MQRGTTRPRSLHDTGDAERPRSKLKQSESAANTSLSHKPHSMGHPIAASGTSSNGVAGPSNGHSAPVEGEKVKTGAELMYEDDGDWGMYQDLSLVDDDAKDGRMSEDEITRRPLKGAAAAKRMPVNREEVVRLILQGLKDMGYSQSADALESESGYQTSSGPATDFEAAIYGGRWSEAIQLLEQLGVPNHSNPPSGPSSSTSSISSGKTKASGDKRTNMDRAKFLIAQQKYLEYLEVGQQKRALAVLRGELANLTSESEVLHSVSVFMMCINKEDLYERAVWDGAAGTSRRQLLERLQAFVPPKLMVPSRRLATLLDQARRHQQQDCVFHDDGIAPSLYLDHECSSGQFPGMTTHILADHTDEVWKLEWSPDGTMLASAGKDHMVVIWQLKVAVADDGKRSITVAPIQHLTIEPRRDEWSSEGIDAIAWSPDGKTIAAAAFDKLSVWHAITGEPKSDIETSHHRDTISCIKWKPDGSEFLASSMDCKLVFYDKNGVVKRQWDFNTLQINDFIFAPDGQSIIAGTTSLKRVTVENKLKQAISALVSSDGEDLPRDFGYGAMEHNLVMIRLEDKEITGWSQDLGSTVSSICLSWDQKRVLASCGPVLQLWSIEPQFRFIRKFTDHQNHGRFIIQSSFAAVKDRFIMSGSEDGHVYTWQTATGQTTDVLMGHSGSVNAVAWNPMRSRRIFASCGDDMTIRIWQPHGGLDDAALDSLAAIRNEVEDETVVKVEDEDEGMVL